LEDNGMSRFNPVGVFLGVSALLGLAGSVDAQAPPPPSTNGLTTPAQSVGLYVFPQKNQTAQVQQQDEMSCYGAAKTASGVDPANPQVATVQAPQGSGGGVRGAAGGAAGGAAIGAIAGDAGKGAAIGAVVGVIGGSRRQREANAQAQHQAAQQTAAAQQQQIYNFKRAMTACLEAHNYSVK
jgi:hypothetical protein